MTTPVPTIQGKSMKGNYGEFIQQVVRLQAMVESPTEMESVLRDELSKLPEVCVDDIPGWDEFCIAADRMKAAKTVLADCEKALSSATAEMRSYIGKNWTAKEIPIGVKSLLLVW